MSEINKSQMSSVVEFLLDKIGYLKDKQFIRKYLNDHPYPGSLLSISDCFNSMGVSSAAVKIDYEDLILYNSEIMIHSNSNKFFVIGNVTKDGVDVFDGNNNKSYMSKFDFMVIWDGTALLAEKPVKNFYYRPLNRFFGQMSITNLIYVLFISTILWFLYQNSSVLTLAVSPFLIIKSCGILCCILLIQKTFSSTNTLADKICNVRVLNYNSKNGCDTIMKSGSGQIFSWLSWSEVGYIYFSSSLMFLISSGMALNADLALIALLAIINTPFTIYSLTYQVVNKVYCTLCIIVLVLIWTEGIYSFGYLKLNAIHFNSVIRYLYIGLTVSLTWFLFKSLYASVIYKEGLESRFKRFKYDMDVFKNLQNLEKEIENISVSPLITIGNNNSILELTIISNPFCQPCHASHLVIDKLLDKYKDLFKVNIIIPSSANPDDIRTNKAKYFYNLYLNHGSEIMRKQLYSWFSLDDKSKFADTYDKMNDHEDLTEYLNYAQAFTQQTKIYHTPAILLNGKLLPKQYDKDDLEGLILLMSI